MASFMLSIGAALVLGMGCLLVLSVSMLAGARLAVTRARAEAAALRAEGASFRERMMAVERCTAETRFALNDLRSSLEAVCEAAVSRAHEDAYLRTPIIPTAGPTGFDAPITARPGRPTRVAPLPPPPPSDATGATDAAMGLQDAEERSVERRGGPAQAIATAHPPATFAAPTDGPPGRPRSPAVASTMPCSAGAGASVLRAAAGSTVPAPDPFRAVLAEAWPDLVTTLRAAIGRGTDPRAYTCRVACAAISDTVCAEGPFGAPPPPEGARGRVLSVASGDRVAEVWLAPPFASLAAHCRDSGIRSRVARLAPRGHVWVLVELARELQLFSVDVETGEAKTAALDLLGEPPDPAIEIRMEEAPLLIFEESAADTGPETMRSSSLALTTEKAAEPPRVAVVPPREASEPPRWEPLTRLDLPTLAPGSERARDARLRARPSRAG